MKIRHLAFFIIVLRLAFSVTTPAFAQVTVDVKEIVTIGGIPQWITAKGVDSSKPILLYLHGGPGSSTMGYADRFMSRL